jgi:hypothetical protein
MSNSEFDPTVETFDPTESAGFDPTEGGDDEEIELDFSDVDPEKPKFPAGKGIEATIVDFGKALSKQKGTPSLRITWQNAAGSKIWQDLWLSPGAMWMTGKILTTLGCPPVNGRLKVSPRMMIGRRALLDVVPEEYNGKTNNKIQAVHPHPKGVKEDAPF